MQHEDALCKEFWDLVQYANLEKYVIGIEPRRFGNIQYAMKLKRKGITKGVADYFILSPRQTQRKGLWLEFKHGRGKQSEAQIVFQQNVQNSGYDYLVVTDAETAFKIVKKYVLR